MSTFDSWPLSEDKAALNGGTQVYDYHHENDGVKELVARKGEKIGATEEPNLWIINDGLLRDEGVLFGLSGADSTEKKAAINSYYDQQKAPHIQQKEHLDGSIRKREDELTRIREEISVLEDKANSVAIPERSIPDSKLVRYVVGLIVAITAGYGCFYIPHHYVSPKYGLWCTCGIFLFGLFTQMAPVSSWLQASLEPQNPTRFDIFKNYLLDVAPSVVATLLVSYLIYQQTLDSSMAFIFGVFLLFLFFFNGKLVLGLTQTLTKEIKAFKEHRAQQQKIRADKESKDEALRILRAKEDAYLSEIKELGEKRKEELTKINVYSEECNNKVSLFLSEYRLASHFITTIKPAKHE